MIKFNKNDKILANIAKMVEKRAKGDINLTLVLDETLGEYNGKYENGTIKGGSYHSVLELCGRYLSEYIRQEGICAGKSKDIFGCGM